MSGNPPPPPPEPKGKSGVLRVLDFCIKHPCDSSIPALLEAVKKYLVEHWKEEN